MSVLQPDGWDEIRYAHRHPGLVKKTFLVAGGHEIRGAKQGEAVELELTGDQIDALIAAGHITEIPETEDVAETPAQSRPVRRSNKK